MSNPVHGGNLAWAASLAGCSPFLIQDFSASINPLGPPQSAIAAITAALDSLKAYPDPDYQQLRVLLGKVHQLPPEWIIPGNGAAELLTWAAMDLSKLERTYLVTPAFSDYWRSLEAFNAKVEECPICVEALEVGKRESSPLPVSCSHPLARSGLLLNNPHNPTGKLWEKERILPYLEQFALVAIDEAFMDFLPPEEEQSLISVIQDYPNLAIVRSLTKFYSLPGLRLGYAIAHPDRLQQWRAWRDPWPVNSLAVAAGAAVLEDREFQQQTWSWLASARYNLFHELEKIPGLMPIPSAANFLLVRSDYPSSQLQKILLLQHQILIRDCLSFPELGDRYFRIAVRSSAENQRLLAALRSAISNWRLGKSEVKSKL